MEVCRYRKVKCYDCSQIQEDVRTLKLELDGKVEAVQNKMENNHVEIKKIVGKLEGSLVGVNKRVNEKVEALKDCHDEMRRDQREIRNEVKGVQDNLSKVSKDVDEVKVMMSQMLEKFSMVELMINKLPSPTEDILSTPMEDILIAGNGDTAEIFSWETNGWYGVAEMNEGHHEASSFIYNDQVFVVGGETKTIETMDLTELPLKWMEFPGELPYESSGHQTIHYQQRVIHISGYDEDERKMSNLISELQLTSPCTMKELCKMPEPRRCHGAEAFEDKVVILGGEDDDDNVLDSVLEFDPETNECHRIASLPHPLKEIATVRWRDQVVVFGGRDKDDVVRNDVFMYDWKTGMITTLPAMLEKRYNCCAVITGNSIIVMGGENDDDTLRSVEYFTIGGSTWKYLPSMNEDRRSPVAEVLPATRKYVYV